MIIDDLYLWSYRAGILVLLFLAIKISRHKSNKAWLAITIGLIVLVLSTYGELILWWYAQVTKTGIAYFSGLPIYKVLAVSGTVVSVTGCCVAYKDWSSNLQSRRTKNSWMLPERQIFGNRPNLRIVAAYLYR